LVSGHIGPAKIENFKELAVTRLTNHQLRERLLQARPDEPDVAGLIFGEEAVAKAAGYKDARHFSEKHLTQVTTCRPLGPHLLSQHMPAGHVYFVNGQFVTHGSSAAVLGDNLRARTREERRANVPGWHKRAPTPAGDSQPSMTTVGTPVDVEENGRAFRLYATDER
jgi:hypothetical protein